MKQFTWNRFRTVGREQKQICWHITERKEQRQNSWHTEQLAQNTEQLGQNTEPLAQNRTVRTEKRQTIGHRTFGTKLIQNRWHRTEPEQLAQTMNSSQSASVCRAY